MEQFHSVVIVGAGVAGLYAAQLLRLRFPDVVVVEAQDRIGGRIRQVRCDGQCSRVTSRPCPILLLSVVSRA